MTVRMLTARVLSCLTTCALAAVLLTRAASAHLETTTQEGVLSAVEMLWRLDPELRRGGVHELDLNGIRLRLRTGGAEQGDAKQGGGKPGGGKQAGGKQAGGKQAGGKQAGAEKSSTSILQRFGALCDPKPHGEGGVATSLALPTPRFSATSADGGYIFCLARSSPLTLGDVGATFDDLARSGDLSVLGNLRGVVVHGSRVLTIESLGAVPLRAFSGEGRLAQLAPMAGLPMPEGEHLLSVGLDGRVLLTATRTQLASPLAEYEQSLRQAGLDVLAPPQAAPQAASSLRQETAAREIARGFESDVAEMAPPRQAPPWPDAGEMAPPRQDQLPRSRVIRSKDATWIVVHELADTQDWIFITRLPD